MSSQLPLSPRSLLRRALPAAALGLMAVAAPAAAQDPIAFRAYVESASPLEFCGVYPWAPVCKALETAGVDYVKTTPAEIMCMSGATVGPVCAANIALTSRVSALEKRANALADANWNARETITRIRSVERDNARLRKLARASIASRIGAMPAADVWRLVAVIASRLSWAGEPYGASRYVNRDSTTDYTSWTLTRAVYSFGQ